MKNTRIRRVTTEVDEFWVIDEAVGNGDWITWPGQYETEYEAKQSAKFIKTIFELHRQLRPKRGMK